MVHRKGIIHCSCANAFIQRKKFSDTNATSHAFEQISDLKISPEHFPGPLKTLWRDTCGTQACKILITKARKW